MRIVLLKIAGLLFLCFLCACHSADPLVHVEPVVKCCGGLNLSSLVDNELIKCGATYGGNGFNRRLVEKSDRGINNIARCAKREKRQGRSYLVEYNFSMLPDYEESSFVIFKPDNTGVIVSYDSDGETNWSASVKNCTYLVMMKDASFGGSKCDLSPDLEAKLGIKKKIK